MCSPHLRCQSAEGGGPPHGSVGVLLDHHDQLYPGLPSSTQCGDLVDGVERLMSEEFVFFGQRSSGSQVEADGPVSSDREDLLQDDAQYDQLRDRHGPDVHRQDEDHSQAVHPVSRGARDQRTVHQTG